MAALSVESSPWLTMWTRPRQTVRALVENNPRRLVLLLAALAGVSQALNRASFQSMGDDIPLSTILGVAVVLGPLFGILTLYIGGALIAWTGRWIGGSGTSEHLRTALAWGSLPAVGDLMLWVPALIIFGDEMFTTATPRVAASPALAILLMIYGLVSIALGVWTLIIMAKAVGEVQRFSAWRAVGNMLLAGAVIIVPVIAVGVTIAILAPA